MSSTLKSASSSAPRAQSFPSHPYDYLPIFNVFVQNNKRNNARVIYNTSLPVIFGVKKYADALWKVVEGRDIDVNLRTNLVSIEPGKNVATFENLEKPGETYAVNVNIYHLAIHRINFYPKDVLVRNAECDTTNVHPE